MDYEKVSRDFQDVVNEDITGLLPSAISAALDAATESNRAGDEPQQQLITAIAVYLHVVHNKGKTDAE